MRLPRFSIRDSYSCRTAYHHSFLLLKQCAFRSSWLTTRCNCFYSPSIPWAKGEAGIGTKARANYTKRKFIERLTLAYTVLYKAVDSLVWCCLPMVPKCRVAVKAVGALLERQGPEIILFRVEVLNNNNNNYWILWMKLNYCPNRVAYNYTAGFVPAPHCYERTTVRKFGNVTQCSSG